MPLIQTVFNGNYVVWQRKLAEVVVDLKSDKTGLQKFGVIIAESSFYQTHVAGGIFISVEVASSAAPNTWTLVHGSSLSGGAWISDSLNQVAPSSGAWMENVYVHDALAGVDARYVRFRVAADASFTPLQMVALRKVLIRDVADQSLSVGATTQTNELGWQTGETLKDILEDLLEGRLLLDSITGEVIAARESPTGTWDGTTENYGPPVPRIFSSLKARLDDLEQDAERRLAARKVVVPVEDIENAVIGQSEFVVGIQADIPNRLVKQYASVEDVVDVLVQVVEGTGEYEEPLRDNGVLIVGRVNYGVDTLGYVTGENARVQLIHSDTQAVYSMPVDRSLKFIVPVETNLKDMTKYDLTRNQFATSVIQDIGVLNDIDALQDAIRQAIASDMVSQKLIVYENGGLFYADLVLDSRALDASEWTVTKDGGPAVAGTDFVFIDSRKIRLDTHDSTAPTEWSIQFFTRDRLTLDTKINEIIEALAKISDSVMNLFSSISLTDALASDDHWELLQFDYSGNDGYDYFRPLSYVAKDADNTAAVIYKNDVAIGAKDIAWAFREDGVVALDRSVEPYDRSSVYKIHYYFQAYQTLAGKIQSTTDSTDRDLIVRNWSATNPVPFSASSDGLKLI